MTDSAEVTKRLSPISEPASIQSDNLQRQVDVSQISDNTVSLSAKQTDGLPNVEFTSQTSRPSDASPSIQRRRGTSLDHSETLLDTNISNVSIEPSVTTDQTPASPFTPTAPPQSPLASEKFEPKIDSSKRVNPLQLSEENTSPSLKISSSQHQTPSSLDSEIEIAAQLNSIQGAETVISPVPSEPSQLTSIPVKTAFSSNPLQLSPSDSPNDSQIGESTIIPNLAEHASSTEPLAYEDSLQSSVVGPFQLTGQVEANGSSASHQSPGLPSSDASASAEPIQHKLSVSKLPELQIPLIGASNASTDESSASTVTNPHSSSIVSDQTVIETSNSLSKYPTEQTVQAVFNSSTDLDQAVISPTNPLASGESRQPQDSSSSPDEPSRSTANYQSPSAELSQTVPEASHSSLSSSILSSSIKQTVQAVPHPSADLGQEGVAPLDQTVAERSHISLSHPSEQTAQLQTSTSTESGDETATSKTASEIATSQITPSPLTHLPSIQRTNSKENVAYPDHPDKSDPLISSNVSPVADSVTARGLSNVSYVADSIITRDLSAESERNTQVSAIQLSGADPDSIDTPEQNTFQANSSASDGSQGFPQKQQATSPLNVSEPSALSKLSASASVETTVQRQTQVPQNLTHQDITTSIQPGQIDNSQQSGRSVSPEPVTSLSKIPDIQEERPSQKLTHSEESIQFKQSDAAMAAPPSSGKPNSPMPDSPMGAITQGADMQQGNTSSPSTRHAQSAENTFKAIPDLSKAPSSSVEKTHDLHQSGTIPIDIAQLAPLPIVLKPLGVLRPLHTHSLSTVQRLEDDGQTDANQIDTPQPDVQSDIRSISSAHAYQQDSDLVQRSQDSSTSALSVINGDNTSQTCQFNVLRPIGVLRPLPSLEMRSHPNQLDISPSPADPAISSLQSSPNLSQPNTIQPKAEPQNNDGDIPNAWSSLENLVTQLAPTSPHEPALSQSSVQFSTQTPAQPPDASSIQSSDSPTIQRQTVDHLTTQLTESALPAAWSSIEDLVNHYQPTSASETFPKELNPQVVSFSCNTSSPSDNDVPPSPSTTAPTAAPNTPLASKPPPNQPTVSVQRKLDSSPVLSVSPANVIQTVQDLPKVTIRHSSEPSQLEKDNDDIENYSQYLELLAQEVYSVLRQRLCLEQERRGPKYPR